MAGAHHWLRLLGPCRRLRLPGQPRDLGDPSRPGRAGGPGSAEGLGEVRARRDPPGPSQTTRSRIHLESAMTRSIRCNRRRRSASSSTPGSRRARRRGRSWGSRRSRGRGQRRAGSESSIRITIGGDGSRRLRGRLSRSGTRIRSGTGGFRWRKMSLARRLAMRASNSPPLLRPQPTSPRLSRFETSRTTSMRRRQMLKRSSLEMGNRSSLRRTRIFRTFMLPDKQTVCRARTLTSGISAALIFREKANCLSMPTAMPQTMRWAYIWLERVTV